MWRFGTLSGPYQQMNDNEKSKEQIAKETEELRARIVQLEEELASLHSTDKSEQTSEHHFRLIADALPVLISRVDADRRYRFANKAYEGWYGLSPAKLYGRRIDEFLSEADYRLICKNVDTVLDGRAVTFEYEREIHTRGGGTRHVSASYVPDIDDSGKVRGFFALVTDITDLKKAEEERSQLQQQLHQAQKMEAIGELAGGVAHDFNNLLTVVFSGTANLKSLIQDDKESRESVEMIESAAKAASDITKSLMTFSSRVPIKKKPLNLGLALETALKLLHKMLPANITLEVDVPDHAECPWVLADQTQLQQILLNLTINARDAMPKGGPIKVSVIPDSPYMSDMDKQWASFVVADAGRGISPELLSRVFDPFFTTKPRGEGTGLGLSVVHGIVSDHEGRIEVDSEVGKGSRFTVFLPRIAKDSKPRDDKQPSTAQSGEGKVILLAEDNEYIRKLIVSALQGNGYKGSSNQRRPFCNCLLQGKPQRHQRDGFQPGYSRL